MEAYAAKCLPLDAGELDQFKYMEALIDSTTKLEVYKTKLDGSKLDRRWFLPTLQRKEALASSLIEGTQATLDGVLVDQVNPSVKDKDMSEVRNYVDAALEGYRYLKTNPMSVDFIKKLHKRKKYIPCHILIIFGYNDVNFERLYVDNACKCIYNNIRIILLLNF